MSPETDAPVELSFGAAYERLQQVAAELGADAAMAPERLIALLREGKGLERALREHLDRIEQEVRAIDEGEGAARFRIVDGASAGASGDAGGCLSGGAPDGGGRGGPRAEGPRGAAPGGEHETPPGRGGASAGPDRPDVPTAPPGDGLFGDDPAPAAAPRRQDRPPADAPPTLGFGGDDDLPF